MSKMVPGQMRERALEAIALGQCREEVAKAYRITTRTLANWLRRHRETGEFEAGKRKPCDEKRKVSDATIMAYVEKNPDKYYDEMSAELGITKSYLWRRMHNLGLTRKKNSKICRK